MQNFQHRWGRDSRRRRDLTGDVVSFRGGEKKREAVPAAWEKRGVQGEGGESVVRSHPWRKRREKEKSVFK